MTRRPRVVRLIPVLDFGGVESIFVLQAEHIDPSRCDFRVCTFWKDGRVADRLRAMGVTVDVLGVDPSIRNPAATLALYRYVRQHRPDILHASIGEANFHATLVGKLAGAAAVIIEEQGMPNRRLSARLVHAALYRLADEIVGVSDASCRYVMEREFAPRDRVRRIYNAATAGYFSPWTPRPERELVELVTVGRLVAVKNQQMLIEAFAPVAEKHPNARLTIVGEGPLKDALQERISELGLDGHVSLAGFRSDIPQILDQADAFLVPSLSEGLCIALVEAMARGLPVVATNVGGPGEIVAPLGAGWSLAPTDRAGWTREMVRIVEAGATGRERLGRAARARAEDFAPLAHIEQIHELYDDVLAKR